MKEGNNGRLALHSAWALSSFFRSAADSDSSSSASSDEEELRSSGSESESDAPAPKTAAAAAKPKRNLLRKTGSDSDSSDSDSDSESESESDSDSDEEPMQQETKKPARSRFLRSEGAAADSDDSSDDERAKVVKSAKSKRADEVDASVKTIENGVKINDWVTISNEFDKLVRLAARQTNTAEPIPVGFFKILSSLDEMVASAQGNRKKMNATNAKALNSMKQKVKKAQREHEGQLNKYRADPEEFERSLNAPAVAAAAAAAAASAPKKKGPMAVAADAEGDDDGFETVGAKGAKGAAGAKEPTSSEGIYKALAQVLEARGRKNTDRGEQIRTLEGLLKVATTTYQKVRVILALIASHLDYNLATSAYMPLESWTAAREQLDALVAILTEDPSYAVRENAPDYDDQVERAPSQDEPVVVVRGSVVSLVERLDDEFMKSLQNLDPHQGEYIDRLKNEKVIYATIVGAQVLFEKTGEREHLDRTVMRRLEHIYSKPDLVTRALEASLPSVASKSTIWASQVGTSTESSFSALALVRALCIRLYKTDNSLLRTRAMLSHIYHYALHDDYYTARDMLLMSHLQDTVGNADVSTQILYNRTVVQVGLCAFRLGLIREAQSTLQEIFATQRVKELLAQGVQAQRYTTLTPEQEKAERQRQVPFHMHINLELLEVVYLVSSMLLEVPLMAQAGSDPEQLKKKVVSRTFRRMLDYANRQVFVGPPENKRDHVMQATKALQQGDWQKCVELVHAIKVWSLMPNEKDVKDMLARKIQEEGLRTYLFTYSSIYSTLSLAHLASIFDLPLSTATSIVSKMIWDETLAASLDQVAGVVVLHHAASSSSSGSVAADGGELSHLQRLALQLVDRATQLTDSSERYLESKLSQGEQRADGVRGDGQGGGDHRGGRDGQQRERRGGGRGGRGGAGRGRGGAMGRFNSGALGRTVQV
ncbi:Eukaryotic translation initiation factor 3 subunit 8 [Rhodotorula toruloides ATCC 204091]|nr:Eukaryotic translation initiation factor 3 subunit 8 [Rhodotorula toruloides ATCC 204091]